MVASTGPSGSHIATTAVRESCARQFRDPCSALADLAILDIAVDQRTDAQAWSETLAIADRYRLTLYDAAYLELAVRRNLPLATQDAELRAAAKTAGVPTLGT